MDSRRARRAAVAFAAVVVVASLVPIPGDTSGDPGLLSLTDPFHLVAYAVLAILFSRALGGGNRAVAAGAALATGFGAGIEVAQAFVPWRSFAWSDIGVNAVGAVVGVVVDRWRTRRNDRLTGREEP